MSPCRYCTDGQDHPPHRTNVTRAQLRSDPSWVDVPLTLACTSCGERKPIEAFRLLRTGSRNSWCNPCQREATRRWRAANRDRILEHRRASYAPLTPEAATRAHEAYLRRRHLTPVRTARCVNCLTEFTTNQPQKRFCSTACRWNNRTRSGHRPLSPAKKLRIMERDGWRCYLCGGEIDAAKRWPSAHAPTVDHVIPRSRGGSDDESNLRASHWGCNEAKGDLTAAEYGVAA